MVFSLVVVPRVDSPGGDGLSWGLLIRLDISFSVEFVISGDELWLAGVDLSLKVWSLIESLRIDMVVSHRVHFG